CLTRLRTSWALTLIEWKNLTTSSIREQTETEEAETNDGNRRRNERRGPAVDPERQAGQQHRPRTRSRASGADRAAGNHHCRSVACQLCQFGRAARVAEGRENGACHPPPPYSVRI